MAIFKKKGEAAACSKYWKLQKLTTVMSRRVCLLHSVSTMYKSSLYNKWWWQSISCIQQYFKVWNAVLNFIFYNPKSCIITMHGKLQSFWQMHYTCKTRSHPEMVGDMSCVTLNCDLSKIPFVRFYPWSRPIYSHQKLNMYIYWFSSERGYIRRQRWMP